jgi:hypothetical protein
MPVFKTGAINHSATSPAFYCSQIIDAATPFIAGRLQANTPEALRRP